MKGIQPLQKMLIDPAGMMILDGVGWGPLSLCAGEWVLVCWLHWRAVACLHSTGCSPLAALPTPLAGAFPPAAGTSIRARAYISVNVPHILIIHGYA